MWPWYLTMVAITVFNAVWYLRTLRKLSGSSVYNRSMRIFGGFFVLGCGFRAVLPRIDVERVCFFPGVLSSTIIGRSFATVAELSFMWQMCYFLYTVASDLQRCNPVSKLFPIVRLMCVVIAAVNPVAQTFCWLGITTTYQKWHVYEQSIWTCSVALLCASSVVFVRQHFPPSASASHVRRLLILFCLGAPFFLIFMIFNDIPMYYNRWLQNEHDGVTYYNVTQGLADATACKVITRRFVDWKEDMPWITGYFSVCVWISIVLSQAPRVYGEPTSTSSKKTS